MKLRLITLKNQKDVFNVDVEPTETILDLKKKVSAAKGFDVDKLKIIFKGKIFEEDAKAIESCNFNEKDTIVVMELKKKATLTKPEEKKEEKKEETKKEEATATTATTTSTSVSAPAPVPAPVPAPAPAVAAPAPAPATTQTTTTTQPQEQTAWDASGSSFVTGPAYEQAVNNLMEMGFEKEQIVKAMRASFNNPDRAAEYLMNGIPEHLLAPAQPPAEAQPAAAQADQPTATTPATATQPAATAAAPGGSVNLFEAAAAAAANRSSAPAAQNELSFLRDNPQFQRIREVVQANPQLIQPLIQQLGQSNPELFEVISQNPDAFVRLLEEGTAAEGEGEAHPPGAIPIQITQEEAEAITRLEALGFDRGLVIEAYLACDKNEELAANYLFNTQNEHWD